VDEPPLYTGPIDPRNRSFLGACLSLVGLASMALATLLLLITVGSPALAFKLEAGFYPPDSGSAVHSARTEVVVAAVLIVLSTVLALVAVIFRSAIGWRLIGGINLLVPDRCHPIAVVRLQPGFLKRACLRHSSVFVPALLPKPARYAISSKHWTT
jgi:hypothetical protein